MKTQTIHLPDKIILIHTDNTSPQAEITRGWVYDKADHKAEFIAEITELGARLWDETTYRSLNQYAKIIAANPALGDLPLLPMPDDEVEKLALEHIDTIMFQEPDLRMQAYNSYVLGYKAAKHNSSTKDELIEAIDNAFAAGVGFSSLRTFKVDLEKFKQDYFKALDQKQKPQFIPEMEEAQILTVKGNADQFNEYKYTKQPKAVDGKLCGKWETIK